MVWRRISVLVIKPVGWFADFILCWHIDKHCTPSSFHNLNFVIQPFPSWVTKFIRCSVIFQISILGLSSVSTRYLASCFFFLTLFHHHKRASDWYANCSHAIICSGVGLLWVVSLTYVLLQQDLACWILHLAVSGLLFPSCSPFLTSICTLVNKFCHREHRGPFVWHQKGRSYATISFACIMVQQQGILFFATKKSTFLKSTRFLSHYRLYHTLWWQRRGCRSPTSGSQIWTASLHPFIFHRYLNSGI